MAGKRTSIEVHVQPGAKSDEITGLKGGVLWARVTAPPRKGQANRALLELLAQALGVPGSALDLVRGHTTRNKVIAIDGVSRNELDQKLARVCAGKGSLQG